MESIDAIYKNISNYAVIIAKNQKKLHESIVKWDEIIKNFNTLIAKILRKFMIGIGVLIGLIVMFGVVVDKLW